MIDESVQTNGHHPQGRGCDAVGVKMSAGFGPILWGGTRTRIAIAMSACTHQALSIQDQPASHKDMFPAAVAITPPDPALTCP